MRNEKIRKISKEPGSEKITIKLNEITDVVNRLVDKVEELQEEIDSIRLKSYWNGDYRPRRLVEAERNNPPQNGTGESTKCQKSESTFFCGLCPHCEVYIAPGFMVDYENPFCPACGGDVYELAKIENNKSPTKFKEAK